MSAWGVRRSSAAEHLVGGDVQVALICGSVLGKMTRHCCSSTGRTATHSGHMRRALGGLSLSMLAKAGQFSESGPLHTNRCQVVPHFACSSRTATLPPRQPHRPLSPRCATIAFVHPNGFTFDSCAPTRTHTQMSGGMRKRAGVNGGDLPLLVVATHAGRARFPCCAHVVAAARRGGSQNMHRDPQGNAGSRYMAQHGGRVRRHVLQRPARATDLPLPPGRFLVPPDLWVELVLARSCER